jgi:hypothetical protein
VGLYYVKVGSVCNNYIYIYIYCTILKCLATPSDFHTPLPSIVPLTCSIPFGNLKEGKNEFVPEEPEKICNNYCALKL